VGVALAQTGLGCRTRFAAAALVIGANLPDIDAVTMLGDLDLSLCWRRGWTHGALAMALMPALLACALWGSGRLFGQGRGRPKGATLLWLSYLAFLTHPLLDWLNTYGIRLLMPFDGGWFYGDTLFIVDPWIWLLLGGAIFLSHSRRAASLLGWVVATLLAALLVWTVPPAALWPLKLIWTTGVAVFFLMRVRRSFFAGRSAERLAGTMLAVTALYILLMVVSARISRGWVFEEFARRGVTVERLMVGPVMVTPFTREVIAQTPAGYRFGTLELLPGPRLTLEEGVLPKPDDSEAVSTALASPSIRGLVNWARFPWVEVDSNTVYVMDARFGRSRSSGFGAGAVQRK